MRSPMLVALILGAALCWLVLWMTRGGAEVPAVVRAAPARGSTEVASHRPQELSADRREASTAPQGVEGRRRFERDPFERDWRGPLPEAGMVRIELSVVDQENQPIGGATIRDVDESELWATTNARGEADRLFSLDRLLRAQINFEARAEGFCAGRGEVRIQHGRRGGLDSGAIVSETIVLGAAGSLSGRVLQHAGGLRAWGATVIALEDTPQVAGWIASGEPIPWGAALQATCDEQGRFRFDPIPRSIYRIGASRGGVQWVWSEPVTVPQGEEVTIPDLILLAPLPPRPVLTGRVIDSNAEPVPGAHVSYEGPMGQSGFLRADESGSFTIPGEAGAELVLHVAAPGVGLGGATGVGHMGAGQVELVLPIEPVLVVRFLLPPEVDPGEVQLRALDSGGGLVLPYPYATDGVARLRWPQRAFNLEARLQGRAERLLVRLPLRPLEGEQEVELDLTD